MYICSNIKRIIIYDVYAYIYLYMYVYTVSRVLVQGPFCFLLWSQRGTCSPSIYKPFSHSLQEWLKESNV